MKVLLDECVPWPMHKLLVRHVCTTAQQRGWGGIQNGELLRLAEGEFDSLSPPTKTSGISKTLRVVVSRFRSFPPTTSDAFRPPCI